MAEFCLDCWNRLNMSHYTERAFVLSEDLELCEGCGQWKHVIVIKRACLLLYDLKGLFKKLGNP